jgi:hypothetical protein
MNKYLIADRRVPGLVAAALLLLSSWAAPGSTLISTGSVWRYFGGGDPGATWVDGSYDDSGWSNGVAKLGFGSGETTTIGVASNGYTTYYFRHAFTVSNAASVTNLFARFLRDDGAVGHLNGVEIFRNNMPSGSINNDTPALAALGPPDESAFVTHGVAPVLLMNGINQLAVEIHQASPFSPDLGFDLELLANTNLDLPPLAVTLTNVPANSNLMVGSNIVLNANATSPSGTARVEFWVNGGLYSADDAAPYQLTLRNPVAGTYAIWAVAVDHAGLSTISSANLLTVPADPGGLSSLVPRGVCWKFWDRGFQPAGWTSPTFDDSGWDCGAGELGYGDGDERTVLSGTDTNGVRLMTAYFRHHFIVDDRAAYSGLILRLRYDDGAAVYLNGTELARTNLPVGVPGYSTAALGATPFDGTNFVTFILSPAMLWDEDNWLAVEVHQSDTNSSDLSFDLELLGIASCTNGMPPLTLQAGRTNNAVSLGFGLRPGTFRVQAATNVPPTSWSTIATVPGAASGWHQLHRTNGAAREFYRLSLAPSCLPCQTPVVLAQNFATNVNAGANVQLSVVAAGAGPMTYQWRKNEVPIDGAIGPVLNLPAAARADGGAYDVFIIGACGCVLSCPVNVKIGGDDVWLADQFAARFTTNGLTGEINGDNALATLELNEPLNPARSYGRTVWLGWTAPANGVARFDTRGSAMRTALAAYTGASIGTLTLQASVGPTVEQPLGEIQFNAAAGTEYQIAVDGKGPGAALALNWTLTPSSVCVPQIVQQPVTQTVWEGSNATFTVVATACGTNALTYQWFAGSNVLAGATNASLVVPNVQITNNPSYRSVITGSGGSVTSSPGGIIVVGSGSISIGTTEFISPTIKPKCSGVTFNKKLVLCFGTRLNPTPTGVTGADYPTPFPTGGQTTPGANSTTLNVDTVHAANARLNTALKFVMATTTQGPIASPGCADLNATDVCWRLSQGSFNFGALDAQDAYILVTVLYNPLTGNYGTCTGTAASSVVVNFTYSP